MRCCGIAGSRQHRGIDCSCRCRQARWCQVRDRPAPRCQRRGGALPRAATRGAMHGYAGATLSTELAMSSHDAASDRVRAWRPGSPGRYPGLHQFQEPDLAYQQGAAWRADRASSERRGWGLCRPLLRPSHRHTGFAAHRERGLWTCGQRCALPTGSTGATTTANRLLLMEIGVSTMSPNTCPPCLRHKQTPLGRGSSTERLVFVSLLSH